MNTFVSGLLAVVLVTFFGAKLAFYTSAHADQPPSGQQWQAKIDRDTLLPFYRGDRKASTERATAMQYRDRQVEKQRRALAQLKH